MRIAVGQLWQETNTFNPLPTRCAEGAPCVAGEVLQAVRAVIGPDVPLVATLDLHANVTEKMVRHADALVLFRMGPHLDVVETSAGRPCCVASSSSGPGSSSPLISRPGASTGTQPDAQARDKQSPLASR